MTTFAASTFGIAPNNGTQMGPAAKYFTFLGCEYDITVADLTDASPASYGALAAGAVGMQQMYTYGFGTAKAIARAGLKKGVPVIGEIAALYDVTMMNIEAVKANKACTAAVYGH